MNNPQSFNFDGLKFSMTRALILSVAAFSRSPDTRVQRKWDGRSGFYVCVLDTLTRKLVMLYPVGEISDQKYWKYLRFCQEKAWRLFNHPEDVSSWQSRDFDNEMYGGAIRFGRFILSCSGLPEDGDEAIMLVAAEMGFSEFMPENWQEVRAKIISVSKNPFYEPMRQLMAA